MQEKTWKFLIPSYIWLADLELGRNSTKFEQNLNVRDEFIKSSVLYRTDKKIFLSFVYQFRSNKIEINQQV